MSIELTEKQLEQKKTQRLIAINRMTRKVQDKIMLIGLRTGCGHVASAMSVTRALVTTYHDAPDAIIILSKGHGALAQYVILNMLGRMKDSTLRSYYKDGGLSGHATLNPKEGIYASTGSLGHGLPIGIGYAIANPDKKVVVVMSDGETEEGSTLESLQIIRRLKIPNIIPVVEINGWSGFKNVEEALIPYNTLKYYSTKGEYWGDLEDTLDSHYAKVDEKIYKLYKENRGTNRRSVGSK